MKLSQLTDQQLYDEVAGTVDAARLAVLADECDRRDRYTPPPPPQRATIHQAALWYASVGIAVFPLEPGTKRPFPRSHGFKEATIDADQINAWWTRTPTANIGIATGLLFDVADLDGWDGVDHWATMDDTPDPLGVVVTPRAGGGGRHVYIPVTGQGNRAGLGPSMDWRGAGGYVVAPPSVTPDGPYWWLHPLKVDAL